MLYLAHLMGTTNFKQEFTWNSFCECIRLLLDFDWDLGSKKDDTPEKGKKL